MIWYHFNHTKNSRPTDSYKLQNISHHSRNMETTSSSIGAFLIDFYQLPSFSPGFHSIPQVICYSFTSLTAYNDLFRMLKHQ